MNSAYLERLTPLPSGWKAGTVGDYCEVKTGGTPSTEVPSYYHPPEIFWVKSGDVKGRRIQNPPNQISREGMSKSAAKLLPSGSVMIAMSGRGKTRGTTSVLEVEAACSQSVAAMIPRAKLESEFLHYQFVKRYDEVRNITGSDDRSGLNLALIRAIPIALPPLPEQKKIAIFLSTVQRAIEAQERIIQATTELKKALMHKLFTEGLRNEPQKQTEIGLVPESWEVCKVGDVAKTQSGGTPTREVAENWSGGTIPWVKTGEINYCVIHDTEEKITPTGLANSAARLFPKGTLLMAMYGQGITRGRVGLLGIEAATNQACASIMPTDKKRVSSVFLYYFFEYHYEDLRKLGHGANQRNMNAALIRSFPLTFPKADEQAAVVTALESLDEKRVLHERKKTQLKDLFRTLLHELMTAKIRVHQLEITA